MTVDRGVPAVGPQQRGEHPHHRRLAGAVGAEQRHDRARLHPEVERSTATKSPKRFVTPSRLDGGGREFVHGQQTYSRCKISATASVGYPPGVAREVEIEDEVGRDEDALGGPGIDDHSAVSSPGRSASRPRTVARVWRAHEVYEDERRPDEGLRARKKRLTRQRISDIATALFVAHGFDAVTVAHVAETVGVSEKTVYNYFPTKESLVFDQADEQLADATAAVRNRPPGVSPSVAIVQQLKREITRMAMLVGGEDLSFMTRFRAMVGEAPQLRAALADQRHRLVNSLTEVLAAEAGVDPRDPEPISPPARWSAFTSCSSSPSPATSRTAFRRPSFPPRSRATWSVRPACSTPACGPFI